MKEVEVENLSCQRGLLNKRKSFTLIEVLIVSAIGAMVISALFMAFTTSNISFPLTTASIDLQSKVRNIASWIAKDVRQAVSWDIADVGNNPTPSHIKFKQVVGMDVVTETYTLSNYHIEYSYDNANSTITRNVLVGAAVTQTVTYDGIITAPFFTENGTGNEVALNKNDLLTSAKLVVKVQGQKEFLAGSSVFHNVTVGVKIRNE